MLKGVVMVLALAAGCAKVPVGFDAPSEVRRLDAVVAAAAADDRRPETIRNLIRQLDSFDPAMRMLSIRTLERMTGQTLGYDHAAPEWARSLAIDKWVAWYEATYPDFGDAVAGTGDE